jgi:integrase
VRTYIDVCTEPGVPAIGASKLRDLTVERIGAWSASIQRVMAPTSARVALIVLGQVCRYAARRGWLADNPVAKLEPAEKPHRRPQRTAILEPDQLARLLDHAGNYRLLDFLAHTGLRIGEALGLTWADIDLAAGLIRVHRQLGRDRQHAPLKTEAAKRDVVLAPALANTLRQHWLASATKPPQTSSS